MALLDMRTLNAVHQATIRCGLSRGALLSGIDRVFVNGLPGEPNRELMCGGSAFPLYAFGRRNTPLVRAVANSALSRCDNAFASIATCERHVRNNLCLNISPGSEIARCQDNQIAMLCHTERFCSQGDSQVQILLRRLPAID